MNGIPLVCGLTNTFQLQPGHIYYIEHAAGHCNLRNFGGGNLWYRLDGQDAAVGDHACAVLPPLYSDNNIQFYSPISIAVDGNTTLVVRVY